MMHYLLVKPDFQSKLELTWQQQVGLFLLISRQCMISDYLQKLNCFEHLAFGERDNYVYIESVCVTGCHYWNVWCAVLGLTVNWFNTQPCSLPSQSQPSASRYLPSLLGAAAASVETEHWPPPLAPTPGSAVNNCELLCQGSRNSVAY